MYTAGEIKRLFEISGVSVVVEGLPNNRCGECDRADDLHISNEGPRAYGDCVCGLEPDDSKVSYAITWKDVARAVNEHINRHGVEAALKFYGIERKEPEPEPEPVD